MKKIISLFAVFMLVICSGGCSGNLPFAKNQRFSTSFLDLFDTASTIIAYDISNSEFSRKAEEFHSLLEEYDHLYDIYKSYNGVVNLYDVNKNAADRPVKVDARIIDLLEYGKQVYELSGGKTNICFGSVLSLWHKAREEASENPENAALPDMEELRAASAHTEISKLIIDRENSTVYFADRNLKLDVGAVAKGYAAEQVCRYARENLWDSAAISIGGNVITFGYKNNDGKTLWNIGIENPDTASEDYLVNLNITELSVVSSGDYQRYFDVGGKRYCHIINPETLMPSEYFSGVSVICESSALGDALSTTLFNMPLEEGMCLVEGTEGAEAVWIDKNYKSFYSSGFQKYIIKS